MHLFFGKYPGKTIHRIGVAIGGAFLTSAFINLIWPINEQIFQKDYKEMEGLHIHKNKK